MIIKSQPKILLGRKAPALNTLALRVVGAVMAGDGCVFTVPVLIAVVPAVTGIHHMGFVVFASAIFGIVLALATIILGLIFATIGAIMGAEFVTKGPVAIVGPLIGAPGVVKDKVLP